MLTASSTTLTGDHPNRSDSSPASAKRILEADRDAVLQVRPGFRLPALGTVLWTKDIAEIQAAGTAETESLKTEAPVRLGPIAFQDPFRVKAVHIVKLALHRIAEDVVCLGDPLEALFGVMVAWIDVRVEAPGELAKSPLDIVYRRRPFDLKNEVEIVFASHPVTPRLLFLLVVRIDVFCVDDVIVLVTRLRPGSISGLAGRAAAGLRTRLVHGFRHLMRGLRQGVCRAIDRVDVAAFQGFLGVGNGGFD